MMWRQHPTSRDAGIDSEHFTVLGKDVRFTGVVYFEGTVRMDSRFEGEIHTKGILTVGEHAVIKGTINATTLISAGKIKGTITATEKVQLLKSAILVGDVHCPFFSMEEGAHIQGQIDMGPSPWADESPQDTAGERDMVSARRTQRGDAPDGN
jgi:cytoskeletal protein CcmA (bactofilin family)